jgi:hypothetical protein
VSLGYATSNDISYEARLVRGALAFRQLLFLQIDIVLVRTEPRHKPVADQRDWMHHIGPPRLDGQDLIEFGADFSCSIGGTS